MAFSLSRLFKGKPNDQEGDQASNGAPASPAVPAPAAPMPAPPASVRTVMPKSAHPVSLRDPGLRQPVSLTSAVTQPVITKRVPTVVTNRVPPVTTNRIPSVRPPARKITFPVPSGPRPTVVSTPASVPRDAPVEAPVMEAPDAMVTLEVGDFIDRLPPNFLKPGSFDRQQKVEFRASELYSDLTKGRASVPASTIYAKVPSIFARPVTDTEDAEIALPLQKLVEQLSAAFQTRSDQVAEENVGEIETPFLQVAKEDGERLSPATGTVAGAIRPAIPLPSAPSIAMPSLEETIPDFPVRPAHRTGQISTISAPKVPLDPPPSPLVPSVGTTATGPINPGKRPPSTVRASVAGGKIRLSGPSAVTRMSPAPVQPIPPGAAMPPPPAGTPPPNVSTASQRIQLPMHGAAGPAASPSLAVSKKTARIQIPPISLRAGGPGAAPRPGTPTAPASVPVQPSPVSIRPPTGTDLPVTFRSSPPPPPSAKLPPPSFAPAPRPNFPPPSFPAVPPVVVPVAAIPAPVMPPDDRKIELGLAAVLRGVPSEALTVEPWTVADDVRFSLPFAGIEKQLSLGRVSIDVDAFVQALPENFRQVLKPDSGLTEIQLPLPEIFQNLPSSALAIRPDQLAEETGSHYPTPFSQKADEDAERFGGTPTAAPQAEVAPAPEPAAESAPIAPAEEETPAAPVVEETPAALFTDQSLAAPEAPAPVVEPEVPAEEPARDIPLDFDEPAETAKTEETAPVGDAAADSAGAESAPEALTAEAPAVAENTPAEPAVEIPAAVEPTPVEEALAVLESTAPADSIPAAAEPEPAPAPVAAAPAVKPFKGKDTVLQTLFMTEEELDAKSVVRFVCQLPGLSGCAVMFADGLRLAGNFPDGDAEGFSAMTPPFYKKAQNFASELKLGGLKAFTVYTDNDLISFFMHADICVSVRHAGRGFLPGVREKLEIVTRELAGMYSATKPNAVDFSL